MTTTLITGANKGLGKHAARRLVAAGHTVLLGSRDPERGRAAAEEVGARLVVVDVTSDESVAAAAAFVRDEVGELDVLVNNAGIVGGPRKPMAEVTADDIRRVYETNVFGAVRMIHAFLPLLEASAHPVVVNVSSGLGSLSWATDPAQMESSISSLAYPSSKSALNMLTVQYTKGFPAIKFNVVDPGYTATDLNGNRGTQTVEEGTDAIVRLATIGPDGPTGGYFNRDGEVPW